MRHTLTVVALALLVPAGASAQTNATKPPVPHDQIVSTNPFGVLVKWINGEYERKVSPSTTLGASASYFFDGDLFNDPGLATTTALARWYPQGAALDGFYMGARLGVFRFKTHEYVYPPYQSNPTSAAPRPYQAPTRQDHVRVVPGAGLEIGYNWLLGTKQNVSIGVGFGLTRTIGDGGGYDFPDVLPSFRLINIGVAF